MVKIHQGLNAVLLSLIMLSGLTIKGYTMQSKVIEFSQASEINNWIIVNDTVMGGRSQAELQTQSEYLRFAGELSLQNNGGFASVRRIHKPIDWQNNMPIEITIKGDGRTYQFRLRTNTNMDGVAYVRNFETRKDEWQTIKFQEKDFTAQYRGRLVRDAKDLSFTDITQLGFMLADKQPGTFELQVKEIIQNMP